MIAVQPQAGRCIARPAGDGNSSLQPRSDGDRSRLLAQRESIRRGLLHAYLAPYRYLGATRSASSVKSICGAISASCPENPAGRVQRLYNLLIDPFLYHGEGLLTDQSRAEELYESFFDEPAAESRAQGAADLDVGDLRSRSASRRV